MSEKNSKFYLKIKWNMFFLSLCISKALRRKSLHFPLLTTLTLRTAPTAHKICGGFRSHPVPSHPTFPIPIQKYDHPSYLRVRPNTISLLCGERIFSETNANIRRIFIARDVIRASKTVWIFYNRTESQKLIPKTFDYMVMAHVRCAICCGWKT